MLMSFLAIVIAVVVVVTVVAVGIFLTVTMIYSQYAAQRIIYNFTQSHVYIYVCVCRGVASTHLRVLVCVHSCILFGYLNSICGSDCNQLQNPTAKGVKCACCIYRLIVIHGVLVYSCHLPHGWDCRQHSDCTSCRCVTNSDVALCNVHLFKQ